MAEHLRALAIILTLSGFVYILAKPAYISALVSLNDFNRRRNAWFGVVLAAFLAHSFWLYILIAGTLVAWTNARERNYPALYFWLLFAGSALEAPLDTAFNVDFAILMLGYRQLITLIVLVPAWFAIMALDRKSRSPVFGVADNLVNAYLVWSFILGFRDTTFSDGVRNGVYLSLEVYLPYFVFSRYVRSYAQLREIFASFVLAAAVLAIIGMFETSTNWLLYRSLDSVYDMWFRSPYLFRGDRLRAMVSTEQPIVFGYVMAVAIGFYYFLWRSISGHRRYLGVLLLVGGALASLSRGPWIGALSLPFIWAATSRTPIPKLLKMSMTTLLVVVVLVISPWRSVVVDHLPFIGTVDAENVDYRKTLIDVAIAVIGKNPIAGSSDVLANPYMQDLEQAGWIVDIVNSYVGIGLAKGMVGLFLFVSIFLAVIVAIARHLYISPDKESDEYRAGQSIVATLVMIMIVIATVSSIGSIPVIYWAILGMGVAYMRVVLTKSSLVPLHKAKMGCEATQ